MFRVGEDEGTEAVGDGGGDRDGDEGLHVVPAVDLGGSVSISVRSIGWKGIAYPGDFARVAEPGGSVWRCLVDLDHLSGNVTVVGRATLVEVRSGSGGDNGRKSNKDGGELELHFDIFVGWRD